MPKVSTLNSGSVLVALQVLFCTFLVPWAFVSSFPLPLSPSNVWCCSERTLSHPSLLVSRCSWPARQVPASCGGRWISSVDQSRLGSWPRGSYLYFSLCCMNSAGQGSSSLFPLNGSRCSGAGRHPENKHAQASQPVPGVSSAVEVDSLPSEQGAGVFTMKEVV